MIEKFTNADFETFLTKNFKVKEFASKDGTPKLQIDLALVNILQKIREKYNEPIIVVSGYRSDKHNTICGGAKTSKHLTGEAIDFRFSKDNNIDKLCQVAIDLYYKYDIKGIGIYINRQDKNFIHFDNRTNNTIWINDLYYQEYYNDIYSYLIGKNYIKQIAL